MNLRSKSAAIVVVGLLGATGCTTTKAETPDSTAKPRAATPSSKDSHEHPHHSAEEPLLILADDPMADASFVEYVRESDLVLRGTVVAEERGPQFPGMPPYTLLTLDPTAILQGEAPNGVKVLMLTETESGRPIQVEGRPELTGYESVWMLKAVDPMFNRPGGEFVLTGNAGLLPGDSQGVIDVGATEETPALVDAEEIGTLDQIEEIVTPTAE